MRRTRSEWTVSRVRIEMALAIRVSSAAWPEQLMSTKGQRERAAR